MKLETKRVKVQDLCPGDRVIGQEAQSEGLCTTLSRDMEVLIFKSVSEHGCICYSEPDCYCFAGEWVDVVVNWEKDKEAP